MTAIVNSDLTHLISFSKRSAFNPVNLATALISKSAISIPSITSIELNTLSGKGNIELISNRG